jgi:hypothetical protein
MFGRSAAALLLTVVVAGAATAHADSGGAAPGSNGALDPLLLNPRQVSAITGAPMVAAELRTELGIESSFTDSPRCASAWAPAQAAAYAKTPWATFSEALLADAKDPKPVRHSVAEAVFDFASARAAADFVSHVRSDWQGCSNRTVTYQAPGKPGVKWEYGATTVSRDGTVVAMAQHPSAAPEFSCERALTHRANIVIDTMACGADSAGQAVSVATTIGERIARSV